MVVKVDATGTALITTVAGASVNYTGITVGTGVDRALVVTVACAAAVTAPNAHWDTAGANQAMTLITAVETQTNVTTFMFGLRNPVAGAKTLNVAWTTSAASNVEAISFTDVDQTSDAKAFINANFVKDGATVSSILMGLVSPADSIAVASCATSATFSSLTGTNLFTDTTNTGCEGAASRSNGAGATINFTAADTSTAGNKVMVGFVVAPVITVSPPPLSDPVRPKIASGLAIAIMASGLFSGPLPPKEDVAKVDRWYTSWVGPVWPKWGLAAHEQQFFASPGLTKEDIPRLKWVNVWEQPLRAKPGLAAHEQQFLAFTVPAREDIPRQKWTVLWQDPVRVRPALGIQHQPASAFLPLVPTAATIQDWPDFAKAKPRAIEIQPLPFGPFPIAATPPTGWNQPWSNPTLRKTAPVPDQSFMPPQIAPIVSTAIVASEDGSSGPIFKYRLIYKAKTEPIVFTVATPTGWNDPLEVPVRNWQRSTAYTAPFLALGVPPAQVWFPPNVTPDFAPAAKRPVNFQPWTFLEPPPQVFFPYAPWDDSARRKKPQPLDTQPLAWNSFQFTTTVPTMAWTNWPDFAPRAKPATDPQSFAFVPLATTPTVVYDWPDFARRKPQPLDTQPLAWAPQTIAATVPTWTTWTPWPDQVPTRKKPVADLRPWTFLEPPPQVFFPYAPWPDFAPKAKPLVDIRPWTFVPPPRQVFFPYGPWDDFARRKPQPLDTAPLIWSGFTPVPPVSTAVVASEDGSSGPTFKWRLIYRVKTEPVFVPPVVVPTMAWVRWPDFAPKARPSTDPQSFAFVPLVPTATVIADWPDFARRKPQPLDTQLFGWSSTQFATAVPTMAWANWPDFAERRQQPPTDPQSFVFTPEPSYTTVVHDWPDFTRRKPQPLDTQPLIWAPQTIAAAAPTMPWVRWPDSVPAARRTAEFQPFEFVALPPSGTVIADWPDFARRKPQLPDTQPLIWGAFTPTPAAAFFLVPDRWPDFATKKRPLNYDPLAFLQTVTSPFNSFVNWPDFATKKKPAADFIPWTFIPTPRQVFFPYGPWDDFTRRKVPLIYDPLAFLQTVRTPWVTMTTWPDFAPIRGKIGLHPTEQQFTARFPGTLFGATVTVTMSAFEVNTDGAAAAILVVQSQPAVDAAVAIKEIGILGGSVTP